MDTTLDLSRIGLRGRESAVEASFAAALSPMDARDYDEFVTKARAGHYSQSRAWASVAEAAKPVSPYYFLLRKNGRVIGAALVLRAKIAGVPLPLAQVERGPVVDRIEDLPEVLEALKSATLRHGIARLSVMPYWHTAPAEVGQKLAALGFTDHQSFAGRHARSLRLDLTSIDPADPFAAPGLAKVRQGVKRAERAGATARKAVPADLAAFRRMHEELQSLSGKALPQQGWYDALAEYFFASDTRGAAFVSEFEDEPISVILITRHGGIATYALGASTGKNFKFNKMMLPMAHAILWAKSVGATTFDMGGIPMEGDPDPKRASIAEFKYAFSHTEISLVHEHVRWF
ncbi:lipid II:glycine glycyltransferase (peptidoglycan interpeptide bridge formation enzyme) [Rhizomicrobium palustre]|uniref:Lipid II:glycine glycyltransferase (Peptidoglycan interpeptide bridge formation enzyme) n=1 Tax=Rhizomicrobium palustre TaxID=189966 RepID=A0A846MVY8_9PROT|nr:peptidoglycan bridge formation glycyltransferase FemA/FemB family protein [Rhizomicrobium palustre]NIK87389.1 lipid II:glycine glycyltransferase (peptidoglycan interpeptide bridge formation enzyme) [Rhizomicrobium palustre]